MIDSLCHLVVDVEKREVDNMRTFKLQLEWPTSPGGTAEIDWNSERRFRSTHESRGDDAVAIGAAYMADDTYNPKQWYAVKGSRA